MSIFLSLGQPTIARSLPPASSSNKYIAEETPYTSLNITESEIRWTKYDPNNERHRGFREEYKDISVTVFDLLHSRDHAIARLPRAKFRKKRQVHFPTPCQLLSLKGRSYPS
jgi:hypothetical protein